MGVGCSRLFAALRLLLPFILSGGVLWMLHARFPYMLDDPAAASAFLRGGNGAALFLCLAAGLSALGVPRQPLAAVGGYVYGALPGFFLSLLGLTLGCASAFLYARHVARPVLERRFAGRMARLDALLRPAPFALSLAIRLCPLGNNALTSLLAGLTGISGRAFVAGSSLGYVPQTTAFALLGGGLAVGGLWQTVLAAVLFACSTLLGLYVYCRVRKGGPTAAAEAADHA